MIKGDFHLHAGKDAHHDLSYSVRDLIDHMARQGYDVISVTGHDTIVPTKSDISYAKKKGVLLIPGCERTIDGEDVLFINITDSQMERMKTWEDIRKQKTEDMLIIVPHPYYPGRGAGGKIDEHHDVIDAIEYCHFYLPFFNWFNRRAVKKAEQYGFPLIGTSDAHSFDQIGTTYTMLDCKKTAKDVVKAIRKGDVRLRTRPLPLRRAIKLFLGVMASRVRE